MSKLHLFIGHWKFKLLSISKLTTCLNCSPKILENLEYDLNSNKLRNPFSDDKLPYLVDEFPLINV